MMPTAPAPRRLRRAIPIDVEGFTEATKDLSLTEVAAVTLLALAWWPACELPSRPIDCERVLGVQAGHAAAMTERLRPFFTPDSYFGILRAAHVAKAERRARAGRKGMAARWGEKAEVAV